MPKRPTKPQKSRESGAEFRFRIDAYTPETIPMHRLAQYMAQLAQLLGEPAAVHFERLEGGSTVVVHRVETEAIPKVRDRTLQVDRGDAPPDALRAYRSINKLLREDNGIAVLREKKRGPVMLQFPGIRQAEEQLTGVTQHGSIDGIIVRIGGTDETAHVVLQSEDRQISGCYTDRQTAKRLAPKLFDSVRLWGKGRWARDSDGVWTLERFHIETFEVLQETSLTDAVNSLRALDVAFPPTAFEELRDIRHGRGTGNHGRH